MSGPHRDNLGAAHQRIQELEAQVAELKGVKPPEPPTNASANKRPGGASYGLLGIPVFVLLIATCVASCTRMCISCNSNETDQALKALQACPFAREALGDDIGWSIVGCSHYESGTGGDPINGGCHSSSDYTSPVSGTKGRGSYSFSTSSPAGGRTQFDGGRVTLNQGGSISIGADGTCTKAGAPGDPLGK